jgi:hypothetical protein
VVEDEALRNLAQANAKARHLFHVHVLLRQRSCHRQNQQSETESFPMRVF